MTSKTANLLKPNVGYITPELIHQQVSAALAEDIGTGDVTARLLEPSAKVQAKIVCGENAVLCGCDWFTEVCTQLDPDISVRWYAHEGDVIQAKQTLCILEGAAPKLLSAERSALNFLQTLSGTASITRHYVDAVSGTGARILDTRKTLPGLRLAQKYAVRCGGGHNHRLGLYDMVLIKENHIASAGSIHTAVTAARSSAPKLTIEIEVETLAQLGQALESHVERILLDNMSLQMLVQAVKLTAGHATLEASGGINLDSIRQIAETGVDDISVGALTKDLHAIDFSMRIT